MLTIFGRCAKKEEVNEVNRTIDNMQQQINDKVISIGSLIKKNYDQSHAKLEFHEEKFRNLQREVTGRLKVEEFKGERAKLITSA